jgi:CRISPR-associated protein Cmr2
VAADPWLWGLSAAGRDRLKTECEKLTPLGLVRVRAPYENFPFEGTAVFPTRLKEISKNPADTKALRGALRDVKKTEGEPDPYLCILAADGDRMGERISGIMTETEHRDFSGQLAQFAQDAETKVKDHRGVLVYSGGDDVLAFLPLNEAVACARVLHDRFGDLTGGCTLSVGLAIGHSMEPLEDLLEYARTAEKAAKGKDSERDGLAIHYHPRSGAPLCVRDAWTKGLDADLTSLAAMHLAGQIPDKAGYDLRELSRIYYKGWPDPSVIRLDVARLLRRKRIKNPEGTWAKLLESMDSGEAVRRVADRIILARKLADAARQAAGRK